MSLLKFKDQEYSGNKFDQKFRGTYFFGQFDKTKPDVFKVNSIYPDNKHHWGIKLISNSGQMYNIPYNCLEILSTQVKRGYHVQWSSDWKYILCAHIAGTPPLRQHTQGFNNQRVHVERTWAIDPFAEGGQQLHTILAGKYPSVEEALTYLITAPIGTGIPLSRELLMYCDEIGKILFRAFGDQNNFSVCQWTKDGVDLSNMMFTLQEEMVYLLGQVGVPYHV